MLGISLDFPEVTFPPTYITGTSKFAVKIENSSEAVRIVSFHRRKTVSEENSVIGEVDTLNPEARELLLGKKSFGDDIFSVEPLEIKLWPHSFSQFIITFSPSDSEFTANSYCTFA
jgi:hypothetical protein